MQPFAQLVHQMNGRVRLRIPARKGDHSYFAQLESRLAAHKDVAAVEVNPLTGSVLIRHRGNAMTVIAYATQQQLFTLTPTSEAANVALHTVSDGLDQLDDAVKRTTRGAFDLNELLFVMLLGISFVQLLRGKIFGPATSILSYAAAILTLHRTKSDKP